MEINLTFWNTVSISIILLMLIILIFAGTRYAKSIKIRNHKKKMLSEITASLEKGMTMEDVESKYGLFDNIEISGDPDLNKQYCFFGKDDGAYVTMLFINNTLNSWKLVA